MEQVIRKFVIFQGLSIGILTIIHSLETVYDYIFDFLQYEMWDYYNDIHGMYEVVIPRELSWIAAASALIFGIHHRKIRYFYPIICVACVVLFIQLVREIVLFWVDQDEQYWEFTLFCNPSLLFPMTCRRVHGMITLIALKRLFESEQSSDNSFVRFNVENEECETSEIS
ncbi:AAEL008286-PA [Aedes aegypti]|uniref:AAEL008286-PA n=2 Tax=Aedes aegypti TaxID=7159 RepID=A0A1S4FIZ1_AEDAE|nr:uncharacterized protein LOC5570389 [Aedes aegypti]EAT39949.1 AAEL008286-PA [Aedes aegypti]